MEKLKDKIQADLNSALRGKKELDLLVLRQLSAAILNKEKEKRFKSGKEDSQLAEEELAEAVSAEAKKRREAILEYGKGGRQDLVEKEKKELEILEKYLPEQLSEEEVRKLVQEAVEKTGASGARDIGKVMQELMPKVKGKAEGAMVSKIVKELLSPNEPEAN